MTVSSRRVWRAEHRTRIAVVICLVAAAAALVVLAALAYARGTTVWLPNLLVLLTLLGVLYAWRFGLHPSLLATDTQVVVANPFRTYAFDWDDITVIAPGENGLLIGSEDAQAEAWCVQKSNWATRTGRRTRSDDIAAELLDLLDSYDPPVHDPGTGHRIRRARPDESRLLTTMERAASEAALAHVFPPELHPYPADEVQRRWQDLLRDRLTEVRVLDQSGTPIGFVAFNADTVRHLGLLPDRTRRGYGSALLDHATDEIFGHGVPAAYLWVLIGNHPARSFYRSRGWRETDERRACEFPPRPEEMRLVLPNPKAPRRSRT